jgi:hypothetical protein
MSTLTAAGGAGFAPGSNLRGAVGGASWCFLLPGLHIGRVVCLGRPSPAALATLTDVGAEVVVCASAFELRRLRRAARPSDLADVALLELGRRSATPLEGASADLVVVPKLPWSRRARGRRIDEAKRLLKPDGAAYVEGRFLGRILDGTRLWVSPAAGEVRLAALLGDQRTITFLERRFLNPRVLRPQLLRRPRRVIARQPTVGRFLGRGALLLSRSRNVDLGRPPQYVRSLATSAGIDVNDRRWALAAPGDYPSQKVLLFLFGPEDARPEAVVKITREPTLNARLANEWRALVDLRARDIGGDGSVPQPLFFGTHAGRGVLGETAIEGVRFRERTRATANCPYALAVVDWLVELAAATAVPAESGSNSALSALEALFEEFTRMYQLPTEHEDFLGAQVSALVGGDGLPLVFQHGDPGPWNVLVGADGRPALLDWEAAHPRGLPLWDLFHFLRSYGLAVSRAAGTRDRLRSFAEHHLNGSPLTEVLVAATRQVCTRTGLAPGLVEPLFFTCWMHRAFKEAATLPPDRLASGRYVNILRLALDRRESPGLQRLFSAAGAVRPPSVQPASVRTLGPSDAA